MLDLFIDWYLKDKLKFFKYEMNLRVLLFNNFESLIFNCQLGIIF